MRFEAFSERIGLALEPFQKGVVRAAAGPERELLVLLPRGNGKTHLLAAIALHHLLTVDNAAVYCAAASRDQARILFEAAAGFARRLDHPNLVVRHLEMRYCDDPSDHKVFSRHLRVLAADAPRLHGLTPSLAICDELHAHPSDEVYLALATSLLKRQDAKLITISTAGQGADSPLGRLRARALAQPTVTTHESLTDARGPGLRMLDWSTPQDADVDDATLVKGANPASWITVDGLREQRQAVPDLAYRRFHANQWTEREGHWLPPGAWQACVGSPVFEDGEPIWIGVDVGGERSASAVSWVNRDLHVGVDIFHGERGVLDCIETIRDLASRHVVQEVAYDPWRMGQAAQELEREGMRCAAFPQSDSRMIPASHALHAAIVGRRLTLPDDSEFARHAADAIARHSRRGWRIDKPGPRVHIDAVIALCMAVDRAGAQPENVEFLGWL